MRSLRLPHLALRDTPEGWIQTLLRGVVAIAERERGIRPGDIIRLLLTITFPAEHLSLPTETGHFCTVVSADRRHSIVRMSDDGNVGLREIEKELVASRAAWNESHFVSSTALKDDCN
jgi:hypothetical protein